MIKDVQKIANLLEDAVRSFTDIAVLGVSGGVDSSVVASVCVKALGADNVHLVSMPYGKIDTETFNRRSEELASSLGAKHYIVPINEISDSTSREIVKVFEGSDLHQLTNANIRPRVRMNILYSICGELGYSTAKRARVMGTGHLSEDIIGYDTKGGDALCDIFILSDLVKSEVYQLAEYYSVLPEIIKAAPSAGLYPGQTDEQELGFLYKDLEPATIALFSLIQDGLEIKEITEDNPVFKNLDKEHVSFVVNRYKANAHKHLAPSVVSLRLVNGDLFA